MGRNLKQKNSLFEIIVSNRYQVNKEVNSNGWNKLKIHCTFKSKDTVDFLYICFLTIL